MSESISELERLLCGPAAVGAIEALAPRVEDAWSLTLPDLGSLPPGGEPWRRLRCCIATEDIAGPVRNGGIGTTYAALAEQLVQLGHESTILYLRGVEVETGDLDHWVDFYARKGVRFVPVPDYAAREGFQSHADRWMRSPYNMMRYLQEHPMDVVHVSEWRGCGYLSLAAKRQGIAFSDTLFIVKTSSPWMWNRLYGSEPVEKVVDLAKIHAERRSVELADIVVGGSLHLLRWMSSQGYTLPPGRTYVQPNVVSFDHLEHLIDRRDVERGARMAFDEIVFFGRLEGRKGLFVFCQAIERLIRLGVALPSKITFMGKEGRRLTSRPDLGVLEYIAQATRAWPTRIQVHTDFQQSEALDYLLDGPRLAVMPSVIENSSMAIYEAAICGVPCIASDVGGNTELILRDDWPHIFCKPHPLDLGDKLAEALAIGGYVPRPSFDNTVNLDVWRAFHDSLARGLREQLLAVCDEADGGRVGDFQAVAEAGWADDDEDSDFTGAALGDADGAQDVLVPSPPRGGGRPDGRIDGPFGNLVQSLGRRLAGLWRPDRTDDTLFLESLRGGPPAPQGPDSDAGQAEPSAPSDAISICIYAAGAPGALRATLASLVGQTLAPFDILVSVDADNPTAPHELPGLKDDFGLGCQVVDGLDLDAGAALNRAAQLAQGSLLLFLWEGATLKPDALAALAHVAERRSADVLAYMHRAPRQWTPSGQDALAALNAQLITSVSDAFYRQDVLPAPLLVRRQAFDTVGGFTGDYRLLGHEAEFIAQAQLRGLRCETVLRELGAATGPTADWLARRGYDLPASRFRIIRPLLASAPLAMRELMLTAKGLQAKDVPSAAKVKAARPEPIFADPPAKRRSPILTEEHSRGAPGR
jgi:glycosyltransferase involved in cell wall biosynthesis